MSTRRNLLKGTAAAACSGSLITANGFSLQEGKSRIGIENQREGSSGLATDSLEVKPTSPSGIRTQFIECHCTERKGGEALEICVSTNPVQNFKIEIFRTGYYQGRGAS